MALDFSIVNVALPEIRDAFGLSTSGAQWVITAYSISFGGLLLVGGRMADVYGRRRVFLGGLAILTIASAAGGLAWSAPALVVARAAQGTGAALAAPAGLSLISWLFREGSERNRAMGVYGAILSSGFVTGVTAGGALTTLLGWRSVMFASLVAAALLFLAAALLVPRVGPSPYGVHLHLAAALLATCSLVVFIYAFARAEATTWTSVSTTSYFLGFVVLAGLFVLVERRSEGALVPVSLISRPTILGGSTVAALAGASATGAIFVLAQYSHEVLQRTPVQTGLLFASLGVAAMAAGAIAPPAVGAVGLSRTLASAMLLQTAGTLILILISVSENLPVLVTGMSLLGFGHVATIIGCATLATAGLRESEHGVVSGILNAALEIGSGMGAAITATAATARLGQLLPASVPSFAATDAVLTESYRYALAASVTLAGLGTIVCVMALIRRTWEPRLEPS